jgi:hypothetical protein
VPATPTDFQCPFNIPLFHKERGRLAGNRLKKSEGKCMQGGKQPALWSFPTINHQTKTRVKTKFYAGQIMVAEAGIEPATQGFSVL